MAKRRKYLIALLLTAVSSAWAMPDIQVNGLLANQAVVTIDGQQRILKAGKASPEGLILVSSDSKQAIFSWQGQQFERSLNKQITSNFSAPSIKPEVKIERGHNGHYFTQGLINGKPVKFLVDTGAFSVAMGKDEADRLGLDWRNGKRFMASTAGGGTPGHEVTLNNVSVGNITLNNVKGSVLVADMDEQILLGMSFLEQTEMREERNSLVLRKRH
jgi:aspartyl protease family protein